MLCRVIGQPGLDRSALLCNMSCQSAPVTVYQRRSGPGACSVPAAADTNMCAKGLKATCGTAYYRRTSAPPRASASSSSCNADSFSGYPAKLPLLHRAPAPKIPKNTTGDNPAFSGLPARCRDQRRRLHGDLPVRRRGRRPPDWLKVAALSCTPRQHQESGDTSPQAPSIPTCCHQVS
jgi:hypothetical protein